MRVLLVEDDHEQALDIIEQIKRGSPSAEIDQITNESAFTEALAGGHVRGFDVIVLDLILRWTNARPSMANRPQRVKEEGSDRAGLRCVELLRSSTETCSIPVIMYSVIQKDEIEVKWESLLSGIIYLDKGENHNALVSAIRQTIIQPPAREHPRP